MKTIRKQAYKNLRAVKSNLSVVNENDYFVLKCVCIYILSVWNIEIIF